MGKPAKRRTLKQDRAVATRADILDAAIRLFARRGISNTTVVDLAKAIGMTPGALYWHFPAKEDLLMAAIEELHRRLVEAFAARVVEARTLTAKEQLVAFLAKVNEFLGDRPEYGAFFGLVSAESAGTNERVAGAVRESMRLYVEVLATIIRYGQKKTGEFRVDLDADTVAHALIGSHSGLLIHTHLFRGKAPYAVAGDAIDRLVLDGLMARPQGARAR